jgi:hypothetical protein
MQLRWPLYCGGPNGGSLYQAQHAFRGLKIPAISPDPEWRSFDPKTDITEPLPVLSKDSNIFYPSDSTTLYYWRDSYWLRKRN